MIAVQCANKTKHERHEWNEKMWGGQVRRWCAGVATPKETEGEAVRNANKALPVEK